MTYAAETRAQDQNRRDGNPKGNKRDHISPQEQATRTTEIRRDMGVQDVVRWISEREGDLTSLFLLTEN